MTDDLVKRLTDLAEEWAECCGDIHVPLLEARDRIDTLQAERCALAAEVERLRKSLAWYADKENWRQASVAPRMPCLAVYDGGKRSRAALEEGMDG